MSNLTTRNFWNPWSEETMSLQRAFDRLFGESALPAQANARAATFNPTCDVEETESHYLFSFDVPGVNKNDLKVELVENQLIVSGERKSEHTEKKPAHRLSERFYGSFQRIFTLPAAASAERVEASYDNGVLRIAIPKSEAAKNRTIKVGDGKPGVFAKIETAKKMSA